MSDLTPAALYARYSPRPQHKEIETHETLIAQMERMEAYCHLRGLEPKYRFGDPLSSGRRPLSKRDEGSKLVALLDKGLIKHVVAQKLDRVFRNEVDGIQTEREWRRRGVALHLADQGGIAFDTKTATGRLIFKMLLVVAAFEPEQTAERTSAASRRYQSHGRRMSFIVPYGKQVDEQGDVNESSGLPSSLIDNEDELAVIGMMRTMRAEGAGYPKIAKQLNELGFQPRKGGQWNHVVVMRILKRMSHLNAGGSNGAG